MKRDREAFAHGMAGDGDAGELNAPSDVDLLGGIADGREEAFRLLFRRWAPRLGRFLARATGSRETGEDLLQETFLRILRAASRFEPRGNASAWIYRISANLAYSYWRHQRAAPFLRQGAVDPTLEVIAPASENPEANRLRHVLEHETISALNRCPANQRVVFLLKVDQGLTYEEIAAVLGCPVGTAKSRFHFAVHRLRQELKDWQHDANRRECDDL